MHKIGERKQRSGRLGDEEWERGGGIIGRGLIAFNGMRGQEVVRGDQEVFWIEWPGPDSYGGYDTEGRGPEGLVLKRRGCSKSAEGLRAVSDWRDETEVREDWTSKVGGVV